MISVWYLALFAIFAGYETTAYFDPRFFGDPWNPPLDPFHDQRPLHVDLVRFAPPREREPLGPDYKDPEYSPGNRGVDPVVRNPPGIVDVDAGVATSHSQHHHNVRPSQDESDEEIGFPPFGPGLFNFFNSLPKMKPWWKGPNVCVEREETSEDTEDKDNSESDSFFISSINLSTCSETPTKYECITKLNNYGNLKTFVVRYKCCFGHKRSDDGAGCVQLNLKPILDTLQESGAKDIRKLIGSTGQEKRLTLSDQAKNFTIFAPSDESFADFAEKTLESNNVEVYVEPARKRRAAPVSAVSSLDLLLNHIVPELVDLPEIRNEQIVNSENGNPVRLNVYPTPSGQRLVSANCRKIIKTEYAMNGIVHVVDGVITPVRYSIEQWVNQSPKLSALKRVLRNLDLNKIFEKDGHYTLLAPTDEAFNKLETTLKQKLLRNQSSCLENIIRNHIIPNTVCSVAVIGNATTHNLDGNVLNFERLENSSILVDNVAKVTEKDLIASNGVVHMIDTFLLPDGGLELTQSLTKQNLTDFEALVSEAGLEDILNDLQNATVFAPTNEAFKDPDAQKVIKALKDNPEKLREVILYHILDTEARSCDLNSNEAKRTLADGKPLQISLYSTMPMFSNRFNRATVNCARVVNYDEKSCTSTIHHVDRLLVPPHKSLLELINDDPQYTILRKAIVGTDLEKILNDTKESISFLAPNDEAFLKLNEEALSKLIQDKKEVTALLKEHILSEPLCCSGISSQPWPLNNYVSTWGRQHLEVTRSRQGAINVGRTTLTRCDDLATNGVLHMVNRLILPRKLDRNPYNFSELFFLGF